MLHRWLFVVGLLFVGACASDDDDGGSGGGGSGSGVNPMPDTSAGGVAISVVEAKHLADAPFYKPSANEQIVSVTVLVSNTGSDSPVRTDWSLFSLQTADALVSQASVHSHQVEGKCDSTLSVAQGGKLTCRVLFLLAASATPTRLLYDDKQGRSASSAIGPIAAITACEKSASMDEDQVGCGFCLDQHCSTQLQALPEACVQQEFGCNECDTANGASATCECKAARCLTTMCATLVRAYDTCAITSCSNECW